MLKIYNTLSRSVEEFKPLNPPHVGMYTCGPTVYDYMHVGNLRTFTLSDLLYRTLSLTYQVKSIQNITDIDDKIIKRAEEGNKDVFNVAKEFTTFFINDVNALNIQWVMDKQPKVSDYIEQIADYVTQLLNKGYAYKESDGSVYFDISKYSEYGKLSGIDREGLKTGTRTLSDEYTKDDVSDFALWKSVPEGNKGSFKSKLGWGRPGWHIECSVMSQSTLGNRVDVHIGGVDLIFPHHENEIAQSESKTGEKPFVKYWVHGAHMLVDGKKMSKSLNKFYTLADVVSRCFDPLSLRYLYLQTHYRAEMNFTWEALEGAQTALSKLRSDFLSWEEAKVGCAEFEQRFRDAVNQDLNLPEALSIVWEMVKSDYPSSAKKRSLLTMDKILGLGLAEYKEEEIEIPKEIKLLIEKREKLRKEENFTEADRVRAEIEGKGYQVEDLGKGFRVKKN